MVKGGEMIEVGNDNQQLHGVVRLSQVLCLSASSASRIWMVGLGRLPVSSVGLSTGDVKSGIVEFHLLF